MLTIGQTLWYHLHYNINRRSAEGFPVTVSKIGRKWATVSKGNGNSWRVDKHTLREEGEYYGGQCYISREACIEAEDEERRLLAAWLGFRRSFGGDLRRGVTEADIRTAAMLLGCNSFE